MAVVQLVDEGQLGEDQAEQAAEEGDHQGDGQHRVDLLDEEAAGVALRGVHLEAGRMGVHLEDLLQAAVALFEGVVVVAAAVRLTTHFFETKALVWAPTGTLEGQLQAVEGEVEGALVDVDGGDAGRDLAEGDGARRLAPLHPGAAAGGRGAAVEAVAYQAAVEQVQRPIGGEAVEAGGASGVGCAAHLFCFDEAGARGVGHVEALGATAQFGLDADAALISKLLGEAVLEGTLQLGGGQPEEALLGGGLVLGQSAENHRREEEEEEEAGEGEQSEEEGGDQHDRLDLADPASQAVEAIGRAVVVTVLLIRHQVIGVEVVAAAVEKSRQTLPERSAGVAGVEAASHDLSNRGWLPEEELNLQE
ncbi:hypothetical protein TYRP_022630 [Tyrophagus putrescentiae]|nr:hypothetical protein TYRP_022630 [Tyrophagus putrescentiae]